MAVPITTFEMNCRMTFSHLFTNNKLIQIHTRVGAHGTYRNGPYQVLLCIDYKSKTKTCFIEQKKIVTNTLLCPQQNLRHFEFLQEHCPKLKSIILWLTIRSNCSKEITSSKNNRPLQTCEKHTRSAALLACISFFFPAAVFPAFSSCFVFLGALPAASASFFFWLLDLGGIFLGFWRF